MVKAVVMPKLGQSEETVTIVRWRKQVGEPVAKGDILFEIETDKAVLEVESFYTGTLLKIVAGEGVTVPVQTTVAFVGDPGEAVPEVTITPVSAKKAEAPRPAAGKPAPEIAPTAHAPQGRERTTRPMSPAAVAEPVAPPPVAEPQFFKISPRAAKLAKECAIDPTPIAGTGPGGRVVERDVKQYLEAKGYARLRITPTAKILAAREGIDLLAPRTGKQRRTDHRRRHRTHSGRAAQAHDAHAADHRPAPHGKLHARAALLCDGIRRRDGTRVAAGGAEGAGHRRTRLRTLS